MPTLIYLYGPPAAGKLTIAERVASLTGARLFHNHLTVNALTPVFPFRSPPFTEVLHRIRLDVFATAAQHDIDVAFTNNSVWGRPDGRSQFEAFAEQAAQVVADNGGRTLFVQIVAPPAVLEARVADDARRTHGKLVDVQRLRDLLATHDPSPLHPGDLVIESGELSPDEAAARIATELEQGRTRPSRRPRPGGAPTAGAPGCRPG